MRVSSKLVLILTILSFNSFAEENWPRWRGPRDNGTSGPGTYPKEWSDTSNILWKVELPGKGCSTPIVWDHRIYITAPVEGRDAVLSYDWNGSLLWKTEFGPERPGKHKFGSGSNPSVATDGKGLYVYYKSGTFAALEMDGKVRWETNIQERFGPDNMVWDVGSSPVLTEKDVVVTMMRSGNSFLAAFDQVTGNVRWKIARDYEVSYEADQAYTTPILIKFKGEDALLVWGAEHLTIHAVADGRVMWSCGDFNPEHKSNWPPVANPVIENGIVIVPYGRGLRCHGIRLDGEGDVTASNRIWLRDDTGSYSPSPAVYKGTACIVTEKSRVDGIEISSGKTLWSVTIPRGPSGYYASPTVADDKLYVTRSDGKIFVINLTGGTPGIIATNVMGENMCASPVPVEGRFLLRGDKHLFCVGTK
ncbi:MAG: Pyrrolo-quinoline quinone [Lentisphaerae bacterium RIFOXYA12_FULL_48_11]|nr:MAG: Pyrrolo-quinoline quinone [Lentisphaerae bacterium RIFOXYA12_FULL_48_11]